MTTTTFPNSATRELLQEWVDIPQIETDLTQFLRDAPDGGKGALARVPMQRWGTTAEIAAGAVFLASDASSFMTGQVMVLDGGMTNH